MNKEEQKQLIIDIMDADAKDGLYKQQTAVEWLIKQLRLLAFNQKTHLGLGDIRVTQGLLDELYEQAKEMEKERIETAYNKGTVHGIDYPESTLPLTGEQYYNQTYGGNK